MLEVLVARVLSGKFQKHHRSVVNKANHRSSLILKSFQSRNSQLLFRACIVFVRPCWTIVVLYGHLFKKLISIVLSVYDVVSLNVFLV